MITLSMSTTVIKGTPEDKEKLSKIIQEHKEWLEDHSKGRQACLKDMNLEGVDLSGVDLSYADLSGSFLMAAKMVETKLTGANLERVCLNNADLTRADLNGAQISGAKMIHACFEEASMKSVIIQGSTMWDSNYKGANLIGAILTRSQLCDCIFESAALDVSDLYCTNLDNTVFKGASLKYARIDYAIMSYYADFTNADVTGVDFIDCELNEESFEGAIGFHPYMKCPEEGSFIAWKKCRDDHIVKLLIPEDADRTGTSRYSCRASKAVVLNIWNQDNSSCKEAVSCFDKDFIYRKGETVIPTEAFDDQLLTNGNGIHFFLTRTEAELFELKAADDEDDDNSAETGEDSCDEGNGAEESAND